MPVNHMWMSLCMNFIRCLAAVVLRRWKAANIAFQSSFNLFVGIIMHAMCAKIDADETFVEFYLLEGIV